jgi:uncharacterized repeat protein (TIGR01451 family)
MTKNLTLAKPEGKTMDDKRNSIEQHGRAMLRHSAKQIRKSERSKFARISAGSLAMAIAALQIVPAFATIDNTVTATGTGPGGVVVTNNAVEKVDVADPTPLIKVKEIAVLTTDVNGNGKADAGDVITYFYEVTNNGNVTLTNVLPTQTNDGAGTTPVMVVPGTVTTDNGSAGAGTIGDSVDTVTTDNKWGKLGPGDVVTFKSTYTVTAADIAALGGGTGTGLSGLPNPDSFLDDKVVVAAGYTNPTTGTTTPVSATDRANTPLGVTNGLSITKVASNRTNVVAGTVVTYTYTVTNTGTTPITNVTLSDMHKGVVGALVPVFGSFTTNTGSTNTGNTITNLMPGDVAKYTATYTVTQADIDSLQ